MPFIIPENALLSEVDFYVGQNVSIRCREGYQLKGQSVITCNPDETWTLATAKCESKYMRFSSTAAGILQRALSHRSMTAQTNQQSSSARCSYSGKRELLSAIAIWSLQETQAHRGDLRSSTEERFLFFSVTELFL